MNADYVASVTQMLRWKRVSPEGVDDALQRLARVQEAQGNLEESFGSPADFCAPVQRGSHLYPGYLLASFLAGVSVLVIAYVAVTGLVLRHNHGLGFVVACLGSALLLAAIGFVAGAAIDRTPPRNPGA